MQVAEDWSQIAQDPTRFDLRWKYGIDEDVLDEDIRTVEPANWVQYVCDLARK